MRITEKLYDRILSNSRGGFLGLGWNVSDATGAPAIGEPLRPGMFIAAENYYGYVVLHVNADMTLTECEKKRRIEMNEFKLSERVTRVVFLLALIVLALDLLVWRP